MKDKIKNILIFLGMIIIAGMTICLYKQHQKLKTANKLISNYEAVSDHRIQPPDTVYKIIEKPGKLEMVMIPSIVTLPPSLKDKVPNNSDLNDSNQPVSAVVTKVTDSVAAVELNKDRFKFTFQDTLGNLTQLDYEINPNKYRYIWVDGQLTTEKLSWYKKVSFKPYVQTEYRILNNLLDVEAGIKLKTEHLNYSVGINGFYYPKFQKNPGWDVKVGIQYEF